MVGRTRGRRRSSRILSRFRRDVRLHRDSRFRQVRTTWQWKLASRASLPRRP